MSKSLDRLSLLQTFVRIADAGSISAAARNMGLSQPSVSRQLAELESRFQSQLMHRTTHDLSLTQVGIELLADARQLLDEWEALEEKYLETEDALRGTLKVVAPVALGQLHLLDIALQFQDRHPSVALSWQLEDHDIRFAEVGCDCWIKIGIVPDDSLAVESLGQIERMVVATPNLLEAHQKVREPADLEKLPCIALEPFEGGQIPLTNSKGKTTSVRPSARMATNNIFALHRATLAGLGISVMPRWFIEDELKSKQLVDVLPQWRAPKLAINVAALPGRHQPRKLQTFLEALRIAIPSVPGIVPIVASSP